MEIKNIVEKENLTDDLDCRLKINEEIISKVKSIYGKNLGSCIAKMGDRNYDRLKDMER